MKSIKQINGFSFKYFALFYLFALTIVFSACWKNDNHSTKGSTVFNTDETEQATAIVIEANDELKKIKTIYRENEGRIEEIKTAMNNKESDKVKKIAGDLVFQINDGINLGENAISKLEEAESLNINDTFKEYLELKIESLRKQVDAFEYRRQAAQLLSKSSDSKNSEEIKGIQLIFKEKEADFQKLWQEGRDKSQEANAFYKENFNKAEK